MPKNQADDRDLRNAKLSDQDLTSRDLKGADLSGARLNGAKLTGMDLTEANLTKSNLQDADLSGAVLDRAKLGGARIRGTWEKVRVTGADFTEVAGQKWDLKECRFADCDFTKMQARKFSAENCEFVNCDFTQITAPDAVFTQCRFEGCTFTTAYISCPNVVRSQFVKCAFTRGDLSGPLFEETTFADCDLTGLDLIAGEFKQVDLGNSILAKTNFRYARGFDEAQLQALRARGARVSRRLLRKAVGLALGTWTGRAVLLAAVVAAVLYAIAFVRDPQNWNNNKLFQAAEAARNSEQYELALQYYGILADRSAWNDQLASAIKNEIGSTYERMGKLDQALQVIDEALESPAVEDTERNNFILQKIRIQLAQKDAKPVFEELATLTDKPEYYGQIVDIIIQTVNAMPTEDVYARCLELLEKMRANVTPQEAVNIDFGRSVILERQNKVKDALAILESIEKGNDAPDEVVRRAMLQEANLQTQLGREDLARAIYERLRERFPDAEADVIATRLSEGYLAQRDGKDDEAEIIFNDVVDRATEPSIRDSARLGLVGIYLKQGNWAKGEALAKVVKDNAPPSSHLFGDSASMLATAYFEAGKQTEAIDLLNEAMAAKMDDMQRRNLRSQVTSYYRRSGNLAQAITLMEKILADPALKKDDRVDTLNQYADFLADDNRFDEGVKALEQSRDLTTDPKMLDFINQKIYDLLLRGTRRDQARTHLGDLVAKNPAGSQIHLWALLELSRMARDDGQEEEANRWLKKALDEKWTFENVPPNFTNVAWADDPEGKRLTYEMLRKVIEVASPATFEGSASRLQIAFRLSEDRETLDENWQADAEAIAEEVVNGSQDVNSLMQAYQTLAKMARNRGAYDAALEWYRKMGARNQELVPTALLGQGETYIEMSNLEDGFKKLAEAQTACRTPNDCCQIAGTRGKYLVDNDKLDEAREVYQYILEKVPDCWARPEAERVLGALNK